MYRELLVKAYGKEVIQKIDLIRNSDINMSDLILSLIMIVDIEKIKEQQKEKITLECA
jgi:hypothetical protein